MAEDKGLLAGVLGYPGTRPTSGGEFRQCA